MTIDRILSLACSAALVAVSGCPQAVLRDAGVAADVGQADAVALDGAAGDGSAGDVATVADASIVDGGTRDRADAASTDRESSPACNSPKAFLHGNVWPFWWNYRVQCDRQHKAAWLCQQQGRNCDVENQTYQSCDVCAEQDGICIPRTVPGASGGCCSAGCAEGCCDYAGPVFPDSEATCFFGYYRSCRTDCDTRQYDYDSMVGHFYGKSWSELGSWSIRFLDATGNDISASVVVGNKGEDSDPQNAATDALGFFGCYELPTGSPVTVDVSLHDWVNGGRCNEDSCMQSVVTPQPGKHYVWGIDGIVEWHDFDRGACVGPPSDISMRLGDLACTAQ